MAAGRTRSFSVTTDGTKEGTRVVDEKTGEDMPFAVRPASGPELMPGGMDCLLLIQVSLAVRQGGEAETRNHFAVLPGGSA